jgi:formylglycine-generating enzyme required for sulfatase activity
LVLLAASCVPLMGAGRVFARGFIATVPVGNVGNAADPSTGFGAVNYAYSIGEYDVTPDQYTAFLNAVAASDPYGVYNTTMESDSNMSGTTSGDPGIIRNGSPGSYTYTVTGGRGNYPVTDVTFWDATRFANWLDNGQPTGPEGPGTTETGAYTLTPDGIANNTVTRNASAKWALPSENEWYKAAYYTPTLNAGTGGYWLYPTQSNTISAAQADYYDPPTNEGTDTTPVGSYPYPSYYGTYDQGGDAFQWNESIYYTSSRGVRGGEFDVGSNDIESSDAGNTSPTDNEDFIGFRVVEVPEPASLGILAVGLSALLLRRKAERK